MHEVVGGQLTEVLVHRLVAVRQVNGAMAGQGLSDRVESLGGGVGTCRTRVGPEQVAVQPVADLRDRLTAHERSRPAVLAHDVVDEVAH